MRGAIQPGQRTLDGTIRVFLAEALLLPTGLLTAAFLSRRLGPEGYGLFTLAATLVSWIQWTITALFTRATIKLVGEARDWRAVGVAAMRLYLGAGVGAAVLLLLLAGPIARLLGEADLAPWLRLFAAEIPLLSLAALHRNLLIGLGGFRQRALASAGRWTARLLLIVLLVGLGLGVPGAILGSIGASLVDLAIGRFYVRPSLRGRPALSARQLWGYSAPLFLFALSMSLYEKLDLFALKALGATAGQAGIYGAAQNLSVVPGIFALSFSPLLLSTLTRTLRAGDQDRAREIGRDALRVAVLLLPLAGLAAGAAPEIVGLLFGPGFGPSAPLLALLFFGAVALVMILVATAVLTAGGKPGWTFAVAGPLPLLALLGHRLLIPEHGPIGAALVTTGVSFAGALAAVLAVHRLWRILPPAGTLWRSALACGSAYLLAALWPAPGFLLLVKLPTIVVLTGLLLLLLGELTAGEAATARALLPRRAAPAKRTPGDAR